jgi:ligand-binding SRPBCC domain-containing protein
VRSDFTILPSAAFKYSRAGRDTIEPMTQRFEVSQWVPFPVELVFAFFANPSNLPHLMPPAQKVRIEDIRMQPPPPRPVAADPSRRFRSIAAGKGSEILVSFCPVRWLPQRVSWMARIVEFDWNSHFVDEQVRGPFRQFRHRHGVGGEVRQGVEGTTVTDVIEYESPAGAVGWLAHGLIRRQFEEAFAYRHKRLPEILAAAAQQAVRRQ